MHRNSNDMSADDRKLVFSGQYYEAWRAQLLSGIISNDAIHDLVSGQVTTIEQEYLTLHPLMYTDAHHEYLRRQELAKSYVFNRLTLPIIESVRRCRTVREVLKKLDDNYRSHSFAVEAMARRNFYSLRYQDVNDMHTFISRFEHYADTLSDAGHFISDTERVQQLISALTKEFDVTVLNYHMYAKDFGPSFQGLKRMLIDAYERDFDDKKLENLYSQTRRLNIENDRDSTGRRTSATIVRTPKSTTAPANEATVDKNPRNDRADASKSERSDTQRTPSRFDFQQAMTCHKCGGLGHKQAECPSQLKTDEATKQPEENTQRKTSEPRPAPTYEERKARATAMMVRPTQTQTSNEPASPMFMLDSGAFDHMCAHIEHLNNVKQLPEPVQITTASVNAPLMATHAGEMLVEVYNRYDEELTLLLKDVLYVPELTVSLLSEHRITKSGQYTIKFTHDYADVVDTETNEISFTAFREGNGKFVRYSPLIDHETVSRNFACPTSQPVTSEEPTKGTDEPETKNDEMSVKWQWHRRLGHISGKYLKILACDTEDIPKLNVNTNDFSDCRVCYMAKSAQLGHTTMRRKAERRFDIVSTDVLGPFTTGQDGEKFVVTFVDNFSNFVNIALMKKKSEVPDWFA